MGLDFEGALRSLDSRGHAGTGRNSGPGSNIVCAAATVLVRTAARLLAEDPSNRVRGDASEPGVLRCEIDPVISLSPEKKLWLRGVADFLVSGLRDLEKEYPAEVVLKIVKE